MRFDYATSSWSFRQSSITTNWSLFLMARYTAADRAADRSYYRAKAGTPKRSRRKGKITMGKIFRTKRGILGCYKYVNGKRVSFVRKYRR